MRTVSDKTALALLKWSGALLFFMLAMPILVILYQERGITLGEFFLIQGLFRIVMLFLEMPFGYLSDRYSRKNVLILGAAAWAISLAYLNFAYGFWQILIVETGFGITAAAFNGTRESYTYDLLKRMGREKEFIKVNGSIGGYINVSMFISSLVGGWMFARMGGNILWIQAALAAMAVACIMVMPEIKNHKKNPAGAEAVHPMRDIARLFKMSVSHPEIKWLIAFGGYYGSFTLVLVWMIQPVMEATGIALLMFGVLFAVNGGARALFSFLAHRIHDALGPRGTLILSLGAVFVGIACVFAAMGLAGSGWIYPVLFVLSVVPAIQQLNRLTFDTYIHHRVKSSERATVLSVKQMFDAFGSGLMMMLMKPLLDGHGIEFSMWVLLSLFVIIAWPAAKILRIKNLD
ncbi:MAG: MFS transporter [Alphaproteobacteria bacterium]|nr:MFS transporter [Alphaproteobacteria bacterium]